MRKLLAILIGFIALSPAHAQLNAVQTWAGSAGGTANAPTITIHNVISLTSLIGVPIRFIPTNTNTGPIPTFTINIDSGGTLTAALERPTANLGLQPLAGSELQTGQMIEITYDGTQFDITSPINMTPIGQAVDIRGSTAPLGTLLEDGSCYSQTAYSSLFSVIGTNYNSLAPVGCSGGQFAVPDSRGDAFIARDNQGANGAAGRINTAGSNCNAVGIVQCGGQNQTLSLAQLPTITSTNGAQSITVFPNNNNLDNVPYSSSSIGSFAVTNNTGENTPVTAGTWQTTTTFTGNNSISVTSTGTSGSSHPILNPTLIGLRAIKY